LAGGGGGMLPTEDAALAGGGGGMLPTEDAALAGGGGGMLPTEDAALAGGGGGMLPTADAAFFRDAGGGGGPVKLLPLADMERAREVSPCSAFGRPHTQTPKLAPVMSTR
jgi:hypothetical protein